MEIQFWSNEEIVAVESLDYERDEIEEFRINDQNDLLGFGLEVLDWILVYYKYYTSVIFLLLCRGLSPFVRSYIKTIPYMLSLLLLEHNTKF